MSRVVYTLLEQVKAKLPHDFIVEALDDDKDDIIDEDVWLAVAEEAADQVDERLGKRYTVPFDPDNLLPIVRSSSLTFVLETLYLRRGKGTEETNPFLKSAGAARKALEAIGNGTDAFTPTDAKPQRSVSTVTEPARTSSRHGHLSS